MGSQSPTSINTTEKNCKKNWLNMYDYGAKNYDPALGRWMSIDLLAEMYRRYTPYAYAVNNPICFLDPEV